MTYDARPQTMGSWVFDLREGGKGGRLAAEVDLRGVLSDGVIRVGAIPFTLDREGLGRTYRLLFEGRALVRAEPQGMFSNRYDLAVEAAMLRRGVPAGEQARYTWTPLEFSGGKYELHAGRERIGRVEKTATFFRHYALQFDEQVPLALQAFCFALQLERFRRQSSG
ncbi:MAG: hypothetical protein AAGI52_10725 [Bacteroidota bacterium]